MAISPSRTNEIYIRLHDDLVAGRIAPGERLKTVQLSEGFDVSLGTVREALSRLSAEGLVVANPQRGFRAATLSTADLRHTTEAISEIEGICLRLSVERGDAAWERRVRSSYQHFCNMSDKPRRTPAAETSMVNAYRAFRTALVSACGNPVLLNARDMLMLQGHRHEQLCRSLGALRWRVGVEYEGLVQAVLGRRPDDAVSLLRSRLTQNAEAFEQAVRQSETDAAAARASSRRAPRRAQA